MPRWRSRTRATSSPGAARRPASGSCRQLRSWRAIRRTRTSSSSPRWTRSIGTPPSTKCPMASPTSDPAPLPGVPVVADACLVASHRLSEWVSSAPTMEEDVALGNIALDLLGQARGLLAHLGDEDQLAYFRDADDYHNPVICELPNGDFAHTMLRQFCLDIWLEIVWHELATSDDD